MPAPKSRAPESRGCQRYPQPAGCAIRHHAGELARSLRDADHCFVYARPDLKWDAKAALKDVGSRLQVEQSLEALIAAIVAEAREGDRVVVMSNGDFGGIHQKLVTALKENTASG